MKRKLSCVWLFATPWTYSPLGSSVHGILWTRILEWVAIPFFRESSWPRDWTQVCGLEAESLLSEPPGKPIISYIFNQCWPKCYEAGSWGSRWGWGSWLGAGETSFKGYHLNWDLNDQDKVATQSSGYGGCVLGRISSSIFYFLS